jgi:hypothetical protein
MGTFANPSEAPQGAGIASLEGCLVIFAFKGRGEAETKSYGARVVTGNEGRMSTPTQLGDVAAPLEAKRGDFIEGLRIFQGFIRGSFNGQQPGGLTLGIPTVEYRETEHNPGKKTPTWQLFDASPAKVAEAEAFLASIPKPQTFAAPSGATPAAAAPSSPPPPPPSAVAGTPDF